MQINLDFGILVHRDGDAFQSIAPIEYYIPLGHRFLLDFLKFDISPVTNYIKDGLDKTDHNLIVRARDELMKIHPYMRIDESIPNAYVNRELAMYGWLGGKNVVSESLFSELGVFTEYQSYDLNDYLISDDHDGYGCISSLVNVQRDLRLRVFLLLDKCNPNYLNVSPGLRNGIYGIASVNDVSLEPEIKVPASKIVLSYPKSFDTLKAAVSFDDDLHEKIYADASTMVFNKEAPLTMIHKVIDPIREVESTETHIEYRIESLEALFDLETYLMIQNRDSIGCCVNCGKYFVFSNGANEIESSYCPYEFVNGLSCREIESKKNLSEKVRYVYNKTYKTMFARKKIGKLSKTELDNWRKNSSILKEKALEGKITISEFEKSIGDESALRNV